MCTQTRVFQTYEKMYGKSATEFLTDSVSVSEQQTASPEEKYVLKSNSRGLTTEDIEAMKPLPVSFSFGKRSPKFSNHNDYSHHDNRKKSKRFHDQDKNKTSFQHDSKQNVNYERKKRDASEFRFGNYRQYYGYRNQGQMDSRIQCMKSEWLLHKDVLDIGCNAGHLTLTIAKDFCPRSIVGVDIDGELVKLAKRNVRHYIEPDNIRDDDFPISFPLTYGPIAQALDPRYQDGNFPHNVQFVQGNYLDELFDDDGNLLDEQYECFDTILCLSITKWIHLNWGDDGIKRFFKRIFYQLRPSGCLILEAQEFKSYARKKKITEEVFKHYKEIKLFPEMFNEYLVEEVGFETCELIDTPAHSSQGFSRPLYLFTKRANVEIKPKHVFYDFSSDDVRHYSDIDDSDVEELSD